MGVFKVIFLEHAHEYHCGYMEVSHGSQIQDSDRLSPLDRIRSLSGLVFSISTMIVLLVIFAFESEYSHA